MALYGRIEEYNDSECIENYVERMGQYFLANEIAQAAKKANILLSVIGPKPYAVLRDLLSPDLPSAKTYQELVDMLKSHYAPEPLLIAERYKFYMRNQKSGESISEYLLVLRKLSQTCKFEGFLPQALRDRLVCGIASDSTRKRLLCVRDLDLKKASEMALAEESATANAENMKLQGSGSNHSGSQVNKFRSAPRKTTSHTPRSYQGQSAAKSGEGARPKTWGPCFRCGDRHNSYTCPFINAKCNACSETGHIAKKCHKDKYRGNQKKPQYQGRQKTTKYISEGEYVQPDEELGLHSLNYHSSGNPAYKVAVEVNATPMEMELDTGAPVSIIPLSIYQEHFYQEKLQPTTSLKVYGDLSAIPLLGEFEAEIKYEGVVHRLPLVVSGVEGPPLLGRSWLSVMKVNWHRVFRVNHVSESSTSVDSLREEYSHMFEHKGDRGSISGFKAHIRVKEEAKPVFCRPRPVPYALRSKVEDELSRLEDEGIITKVEHSQWAAPIVVVPKANGQIRICGDYKVTVNQAVEIPEHPLPDVEELFSRLTGSTVFSKLDLAHAFQQVELEESSKCYLTINTHMGLYRYNKLPFGVSSAPAIFQSIMDQMLHGLPGVLCRADDVLVATGDEEHLGALRGALDQLNKHNVYLNKAKCVFAKPSVEYMGHQVDSEGLHPVAEKVQAVVDAPSPTNVSELRSYLGLLNYYHRFLRANMSTILHPLHDLLKAGVTWKWTSECEAAFVRSKEILVDSELVVHYDSNKPLKLACDSSQYGVGAVISHVINGEERPIAFASRTLSESEKNYAQVEKEALGLIFGVRKFHQYLYGRQFTLVTDHRSLTTILGPKNGVPTLAAARMQRWALILSAYTYDIEFRRGVDHGNADAMSRLPLPEVGSESCVGSESSVYNVSFVDQLPLDAKDICKATRKDPILAKVLDHVLTGWPAHVEDDLKPYFLRRNELSAECGCVLWGTRVVVPPVYQQRLLNELHEQHHGVVRMKAMARSYIWWPRMDDQIETQVRQCDACQSVRNMPAKAPLNPWPWAVRPWQRIHIDYAQKGKDNFLVVIDSHTKWIEVVVMRSTTSEATIDALRSIFSRFGLPEEVVSDNGPQLASEEFAVFMSKNGIKHTLVPPYHPSSNGAAERAVQVVKRGLAKLDTAYPHLSLKQKLANFLLAYRDTPQSTTGVSPAELMLGRRLRTRFSLLKPNLAQAVEKRQVQQKVAYDTRTKYREFDVGDTVCVRSHHNGKEHWENGTIVKVCGQRNYLIRVNGRIRYVHIDHIVPRENINQRMDPLQDGRTPATPYQPLVAIPAVVQPPQVVVDQPVTPEVVPTREAQTPTPVVEISTQAPSVAKTPSAKTQVTERRYPGRTHKAPQRLDL